MAGIHHDERGAEALLVHEALVEPSVLAEIEALVAGIDHEGVFQQMVLFEIVEQLAHALVNGMDNAEIVAQVVLVFPYGEVAALGRGGIETVAAGLEIVVEHLGLVLVEAADEA